MIGAYEIQEIRDIPLDRHPAAAISHLLQLPVIVFNCGHESAFCHHILLIYQFFSLPASICFLDNVCLLLFHLKISTKFEKVNAFFSYLFHIHFTPPHIPPGKQISTTATHWQKSLTRPADPVLLSVVFQITLPDQLESVCLWQRKRRLREGSSAQLSSSSSWASVTAHV